MIDNHTVYFSDKCLTGTFTAAHTEGRVILSVLSHTGREYRFAFDYGRLRFIRFTTPLMRERRISQSLLERDFWGRWHMDMNKGNIPFGEDFPFFPPPDNSIHTLADFAYLIIKQAYQILLKAVCPAELQPLIELISPALAFNFQALEAERNQAQALSFDLSLILPPFADPRLCFPVMQGCRKRAVYGPCSFCETFLMRPFRLFSPPQALLYAQKKINWLDKRVNKGYELFLTEGDALAAPFQSLETIIRFLAREFPEIPRIGAFSSVLSIMGDGGRIEGKSFNELQKLRQAGLTRIYLGIESGSDPVLQDMNKGVTRKEQLMAAQKIRKAGFELACMLITGYGGKELYQEHLEGTVEFLHQGCPDRVFFSRMTPKPATAYWSRQYTTLSRAEMEEWERSVQRKVSNKIVFRQYTQLNT